MTQAAIFKIKLRRRQIAGFVLAALLLSLNFMMRYGVWKGMLYYNLEKTRYEKLELAYQLKGREGTDYELKNILRHNPSAKDFVERTGKQLRETKDAASFLKTAHAQDREKTDHLKSNRFIISFAVYVIVAFQILISGLVWIKDRRQQTQNSKNA
jgi:hypothetical protein